MPVLNLTKHHGLGNDFLVLLDPDGRTPVDGSMARALCDRHRGVGADGLIRGTRGSATDLVMELLNADGSPAEMSGNGVSCLVQAAVAAGLVTGPDVTVDSAGLRRVRLEGDRASVDMGPATVKVVDGSVHVDIGNPHLVLRDEGQSLEMLGAEHPDLNVELVTRVPDGINMRVHERGVGVTDACGTGACAAALAAREWGLAGDRLVVHQPGGDAEVDLSSEHVVYTVTVTYVAAIEVPCP